MIILCSYISFLPNKIPLKEHAPTKEYFSVTHISDIHITYYNDGPRKQMERFCKQLPLIQPDLVVATGDLTTSRVNGTHFPVKKKEEADVYNLTVSECLEKYNTVWYDIRGNHESGGVYGIDDTLNYEYSVIRGNAHQTGMGYIDVVKGNETLRIIGIDSYGDIYLPATGEGIISNSNLQQAINLIEKNPDYNVIATHKPTSSILNEHGQTLSTELNKRLSDIKKLTVSICGHLHASNLLSYHDGFRESEVNALKYKLFKQMVFKNGDVQMGEFKIGEIPIIPLCPGDGTYNCKYTEIYVGYNVTKVDVIVMSNQKKILLERESDSIWKSDEIINENIKVQIEYNNEIFEKEFRFNEVYLNHNNWNINMKRKDVAQICLYVGIVMFFIRIIGGICCKEIPWLKKILIFEQYSHLPTIILILSLFVVPCLYYFPLLVGNSGHYHNEQQVLYYASASGAKIGNYYSPFYTHGYGLTLGMIVIYWIVLWSSSNFIKHNYVKGIGGTITLIVLFGLVIYYQTRLSINYILLSPVTYLSFLCIIGSCSVGSYQFIQHIKMKKKESEMKEVVVEDVNFENILITPFSINEKKIVEPLSNKIDESFDSNSIQQ